MSFISGWLEKNISLHKNDSKEEEKWNSITHAFGAIASLAGIVIFILYGSSSNSLNLKIGLFVYGATMLLLYTASSLYHLVPYSNKKRVLRILDHTNIYFLIAGTYTPICISMQNSAGFMMLKMVWILAFAGILFTIIFWGKLKPLHTVIYLAMGWLVVFFWKDLKQSVSPEIIKWMISGGVVYSVGVLFYASKKLPYYHAIWHLFVFAGSVCFYFGILFYIAI